MKKQAAASADMTEVNALQEYRLKFYLNAVHAIEINEVLGQSHPHTWEISLDVMKSEDSFVMFSEIERAIDALLDPYQDKNMNQVEPFTTLNPTLENVSMFLKDRLERLLIDMGWILLRLEVSETPTRTYTIDLHQCENLSKPLPIETAPLNSMAEAEAERMIKEKLAGRGAAGLTAVKEKPQRLQRTEEPSAAAQDQAKKGLLSRLFGRRKQK